MEPKTASTNVVSTKPILVDVAIIGGGAAGLATAIFCMRQNPSLQVAILDGATKLGAKILVSGGGRCNVTNRRVSSGDYWGGKPNIIRRVINAFTTERTVEFFESIGVAMQEEASNGKLFPVANKAQAVLDALLTEANRLGVQILCDHRVTQLQHEATRFNISTHSGNVDAGQVVLATGGQSLPKTGSDGFGYHLATERGHTLVECTPALDPLILQGDFHSHLSGISHPVTISAKSTGQKTVRLTGELLWTHFGISGPVVLDVSRHWHRAKVEDRDMKITINFLPEHDLQKIEARIMEFTSKQPKAQLQRALARMLPARVAGSILGTLGIDATIQMSQLRKDVRRQLSTALLEWSINVVGSRGYKFAEATAGGVPLNEIEPNTLRSRKCPNLYFVGEILDVDGRIGGFNFQWAWSSAWVAASALADRANATHQTRDRAPISADPVD